MKRTWHQRMDAIPAAIKAGEHFRQRVAQAVGDRVALADLMAEAIETAANARMIEPVARDGRCIVCVEEVQAAISLNEVAKAYRKATSA